MRNRRLYHARAAGSEHVLLGKRLEDAVAKGAPNDTDAPPDAGLRRVASA